MMHSFYSSEPPEILLNYLRKYAFQRMFRRRTVVSLNASSSSLIGCTIQWMPTEQKESSQTDLHYSNALLSEEWMTGSECQEFLLELKEGWRIADQLNVKSPQSFNWQSQQRASLNESMNEAGWTVSLRLDDSQIVQPLTQLAKVGLPYYSDVISATQEWLGLRTFHGLSDSRVQHLVFLLPQNEAYVGSSDLSHEGYLTLRIDGSEVGKLGLSVLGKAWDGMSNHQICARVVNGATLLRLPPATQALEFVLIDEAGQVFDFHKEHLHMQDHGGRRILNTNSLGNVTKIQAAALAGEGVQIEFKPFVEPDQRLSQDKGRTKLYEIIATVVAFANTVGGTIYLGIDDSCQIVGIDQEKLRAWGKEAISPSLMNRYLGALRAVIKDNIEGAVNVEVTAILVDEKYIVLIDVAEAVIKPLNLRQDYVLYCRRGASNSKIPPSQWTGIFDFPRSPFAIS
ncbi:hypothetical protein GJ699_00295 [Duganella sp. FT80W]|uniref:Schlafen AlbA-2 domain-containing protein n=1 Tax=Duganella guangzhouensis TaxID=2666084 RepID=A0A6I2KS49_9BURK|nr:ATP-binding protein [Duganella guangzhouensis]MRW88423.1 hypothetical protein [Duganella guangzhouensis]